jgi:hypothetical protein
MKFFLPSLIALIIAVVIVFAVLPRLAAPVLVAVSLGILGFALYQHVTLFRAEYALSTWQEQLKFYAPFVMIAGLLLAVLTYFGVLASGGQSSLPAPMFPSPSPLPPAATATNAVTAALNTGIRSVTNFVAPTNQGQNMNFSFGLRNKSPNRSFFSPV